MSGSIRWSDEMLYAYNAKRAKQIASADDKLEPSSMAQSIATIEGVVDAEIARQAEKSRFSLVLPWPPSDNELYRPGARGEVNQRYLTDKHKWYRQHVALLVLQKRVKPLHGRLSATVICYPPNDQVDVQNITKALFDALQHAGCFANDRQIRHFEVADVSHGKHGDGVGSISVTVREL